MHHHSKVLTAVLIALTFAAPIGEGIREQSLSLVMETTSATPGLPPSPHDSEPIFPTTSGCDNIVVMATDGPTRGSVATSTGPYTLFPPA